MRLSGITTAAAAILLASGLSASARPATCFVQINGLTVIDGRCDFDPFNGDGSFYVTSPDGGYFAEVRMIKRGVAEGRWNEVRWSDLPRSYLGTLGRRDACWVNSYATICAW